MAVDAPLGLAYFGPFAVRFTGEPRERIEIARSLPLVTDRLGGLGRPVECAQTIRRVLHRDLVFLERTGSIALLAQQIPEQLAHRIEAVLHCDVLLAAVLEIRGCAHELVRFLLVAPALRKP